jgi:hypothetical protein
MFLDTFSVCLYVLLALYFPLLLITIRKLARTKLVPFPVIPFPVIPDLPGVIRWQFMNLPLGQSPA